MLSDNCHAFWPSEDLFGMQVKSSKRSRQTDGDQSVCVRLFWWCWKNRVAGCFLGFFCFVSASVNMMVWFGWSVVQIMDDNKMDTFHAAQNMKAGAEHDPLSGRQIKGKSGACPWRSHEEEDTQSFAHWGEKLQQQEQQFESKISFATADVSEFVILLRNHSEEQIKNTWNHLHGFIAVQLYHSWFIQIFFLLSICSAATLYQYLYLDTESAVSQLNIDKRVWPEETTAGPAQHSTRCRRNQACYEHNTTAAMVTSGGVTSKPGSLRSSSKHDTCALKVKNRHRLNATYWTSAQRLFVPSEPSFSGG